jgi:hypothetical protein
MTNLFDFPEVQSFVLPLLTALLVGTAADRFGLANRGIGMIAGFIVAVLFVNGVELQPLTAARKIILLGLAAAVVGAFVDQRRAAWAGRPLYFAMLSLLVGAWVLAVTLLRKSGMELLIASAGSALYTAWIVYWLDRLHDDELRATSATVSLGLGTGIAAVIGSSGLFGQLAVAVSAGAGGVMLLALLRKKNTTGSVLTLPAGMLLSLIGCSAVVFADLPWIVLVILGLIPPLAHRVPAPESWSRWRRAAFLTISTLALAGIALAYAWYLAGSSSF